MSPHGAFKEWVAFMFCVCSIQILTTSQSSAVRPRAASTMCSGRPICGSTGPSTLGTPLSRSVISTYEISLALVDYSGSSAPLSAWRLSACSFLVSYSR